MSDPATPLHFRRGAKSAGLSVQRGMAKLEEAVDAIRTVVAAHATPEEHRAFRTALEAARKELAAARELTLVLGRDGT